MLQRFLEDFSRSYKGKKFLVTGGTGFLGKGLVEVLSEAGCEVTSVGSRECDLRDSEQVIDLMAKRYEVVIHAAAVQGGLEFILSKPTEIFVDNQTIHTNLIKACKEFPPKKLIGIGTSCSYPGNYSDLREENFWNGPLEESVLSYGYTKKSLFVGQYALYREIHLPGAHVVLNNLYGPGDHFEPTQAHVIAALIDKFYRAKMANAAVCIWGDGSAEREFLFVDDAVEGVIRTIMSINQGFELLNIAHGRATKIRELVGTIARVFDYHHISYDTSKPTGARLKSLNSERCVAVLGWKPETELEDGIRKTVDWYLAHEEVRTR